MYLRLNFIWTSLIRIEIREQFLDPFGHNADALQRWVWAAIALGRSEL